MADAAHELIRRAVEAWNREDLPGVLALIHPEVEFIPLRARLDGRPYHGHDGMRQFFEDMREEWEYLRLEIDELRDGADGAIVLLGHFHNKTRTSGVELHLPAGWVFWVEGGLIRRLETFTAQEDALQAAGVSV